MIETGKLGENRVAEYLKKRGWIILFRNHRVPMGEIDLIAREPGGILIFIEVKAALGPSPRVRPENHLDLYKLRRMKKAAHFFSNRSPQLINRGGWRVDAIIVYLTKDKKDCVMHHYENV